MLDFFDFADLYSFIRYWLQNLRNSEIIQTFSRSRASRIIDLGVNQKRICDFLIVINSNFEVFPTPPSTPPS